MRKSYENGTKLLKGLVYCDPTDRPIGNFNVSKSIAVPLGDNRRSGLDSLNNLAFVHSFPCAFTFFGRLNDLDFYRANSLSDAASYWQNFEKTAAATPFQNFEWLNNWFDLIGRKSATEPFVVFAARESRLCMIVPFAIERKLGARGLVWLGSQINDYNAPLIDPDWLSNLSVIEAHNIWKELTGSIDNVDFVELQKQPAKLGQFDNPFAGYRSRAFSSNAYYLDLSANWHSFYASLRSSKSRQRLKGKKNGLSRHGPLSFSQIRNPDGIQDAIGLLLNWKSAQLTARGARNPFLKSEMEDMIRAISNLPAADRFLRVYTLNIDGKPIAGSIVLVQNGVMNLFVTAYEFGAYRNYSPGTILHTKLMELAARAGLRQFDFSVGDEAYKSEWAGNTNEITNMTRILTLRGSLPVAIARARNSLKIHIKSNERLLAALYLLNAQFGTGIRKMFESDDGPPDGGTGYASGVQGTANPGLPAHSV